MRFPAKVFKHVCDAAGVPVTVGSKSCSSPLDHFNSVLLLPLVGAPDGKTVVEAGPSYSEVSLGFGFFAVLFYLITLQGPRGNIDDFTTILSHFVLFAAVLVELAKSIPIHLFFPLPLLLFPFTVPCKSSLINQNKLTHGLNDHLTVSISGLVSEVRHILRWLSGSFCEPPHFFYGPCTKCSITVDSILAQGLRSFL